MKEQSQAIYCVALGAAIGAAAGYLYFTGEGRALRGRIERTIADMRRELMHVRETVERVGDLASDGARVVTEFNAARAACRPTTLSH